MKKIIMIIVMLLSVIAANAQKTADKIRDGFKLGTFYIMVDDDSVLRFSAVENRFSTWYDEDYNILKSVFETKIDSDNEDMRVWSKRGEDWFKEKMEDELGRIAMFNVFYKNFGIAIGQDYSVTEDGRVRITMVIADD